MAVDIQSSGPSFPVGESQVYDTVYLPSVLGEIPVDVNRASHPYYKLSVSLALRNNGALGEANFGRALPQNCAEAKICFDALESIVKAIECHEQDPNSDQISEETSNTQLHREAALSAVKGMCPQSVRERLFGSCYNMPRNPYAAYGSSETGVMDVKEIPVELRSFVNRTGRLVTAATNMHRNGILGDVRFDSVEDIAIAFPGLQIQTKEPTAEEQLIVEFAHGLAEIPAFLRPSMARLTVDVLGAGTLLRAVKKQKDPATRDQMTPLEKSLASIAWKVNAALGTMNSWDKSVLGRMAWGIHGIRLSHGNVMQQVTLPKPGV